MATVVLTNPGASAVYVSDIYASVPANDALSITRSPTDLVNMPDLAKKIADGDLTMTVSYTADELASGLVSPPNAVEAVDIAEVAADATGSPVSVVRKTFTAGGGGADDVTVFAVNTLPFKARVVDAWAFVSTAVGGSSITLRTAAGGGGTDLGAVSTAATGRAAFSPPSDATVVATPGAAVGLFLRRSDDATAGEIFIVLRREA